MFGNSSNNKCLTFQIVVYFMSTKSNNANANVNNTNANANEPKVYNVALDDIINVDNFGTLHFNVSDNVKVWRDVDGIRTQIDTNVLYISGASFIRQFAEKSKGHKGLVTALAQNRTLKSSVILGCCQSFDITLRNVGVNDTYIKDGVETHYSNDGTIIDVVSYKLTPNATKLIAKYGTNNVFNTLANDALAML